MEELFEFNLENFMKDVIILQENHAVDYIDAILTVCEWRDIDIETIVPLLKKDPIIKENLRLIAEKKNFLKRDKIEA